MGKASPDARADAATAAADATSSAAKGAGLAPSIVLLTNEKGRVIGRNGTTGARGDDLSALYPGLKDALANGRSGTEIWANASHGDQFLVSYVPLREGGRVVGALAAGFTLNDELSAVGNAVNHPVKLIRSSASGVDVLASSANAQKSAEANDKAALDGALTSGVSSVAASDGIVAASILEGFRGDRVALIVQAPGSLIAGAALFGLWPILGAVLIGLVLVAVAGWLLSDYIDRPIATIEEGLLAIINGQTDRRFGLEHPELGAIASRIDQLLNQLLGVEEDNTDEEGRIKSSTASSSAASSSGDDGGEDESAVAQRLAGEPAAAYYARLFQEYIAAKKSLGEATDHITAAAFEGKIKQMEQDTAQKMGKPVRYRVQAAGKEVKLLAVTVG